MPTYTFDEFYSEGDGEDHTMVDLGGGMVVPLSELLDDDDGQTAWGHRPSAPQQFDTVEEDRGER